MIYQSGFWKDPKVAIREAYLSTDGTILAKAPDLGPGGSTAVTAILIDKKHLLVANVGDSRAVLSKDGVALQLSIDHEPGDPTEKGEIENRGGFVSNMPGKSPIRYTTGLMNNVFYVQIMLFGFIEASKNLKS